MNDILRIAHQGAILRWAILRVIGHKTLEWEGSVSSMISHNAIDFGFFGSFQIYPFPALFLEEAVQVACCLSVPHFRCFIRGTRLNSPVFTPAQLCKCSLRAERVTDAVNSSKRRLLSWRLAIPGSWQGSQQRGGVFEFQERGSETWISICYITPKRSPHDLIWKISATTKNMKSIRCTRRETATKQDFTRRHSFSFLKLDFVGRCGI